ncbi:MerR family transcriptional regulator [Streptacidiphilus sp. ASG 303]|uniref:MerR family transcriptional regulator n=1 Tax=Streptacidiphilus sp. ASG 303 TaxID=2896847 RepID=UPI0027E10158|nr:MerR family transcriptional regulator [Streptacidiphilus sp. ASG 303]
MTQDTSPVGGGEGTREGAPEGAPEPPREYRVEELAEAAGITVRTLRFYRERRLLPPPRRKGRIAWYTQEHLDRLRVVAALLERGHTLGGIAELLAAGEEGRHVAELIGLERAITAPWTDEVPVRLTWEEVEAAFPGEAGAEAVRASVGLGYVTADRDGVTHVSRRLLDATVALVREGVPLAGVLEVARRTQEYADAVADLFVRLVGERLLAGLEDGTPSADEAHRLTESVLRVRPLGRAVADAQFTLAMDRRVREEYEKVLRHRLDPGTDGGPGGGTDGGRGAAGAGPD